MSLQNWLIAPAASFYCTPTSQHPQVHKHKLQSPISQQDSVRWWMGMGAARIWKTSDICIWVIGFVCPEEQRWWGCFFFFCFFFHLVQFSFYLPAFKSWPVNLVPISFQEKQPWISQRAQAGFLGFTDRPLLGILNCHCCSSADLWNNVITRQLFVFVWAGGRGQCL